MQFLHHSYALVKKLISLYNLSVSFLHPKTVAITRVIYIFLVCVFPSPSSDFPGRLKLLYYSPRVCQIPQQLQTHHPSLALCLRGNKVSGFPGWQICVIVLRPGWGNNSVDSGGEQRRKGMRERGAMQGWQMSLPFKVKIEFLWRGAPQVVMVQDLSFWNLKRRKSHPSGPCLNQMPYHWAADKKRHSHSSFPQLFWMVSSSADQLHVALESF